MSKEMRAEIERVVGQGYRIRLYKDGRFLLFIYFPHRGADRTSLAQEVLNFLRTRAPECLLVWR